MRTGADILTVRPDNEETDSPGQLKGCAGNRKEAVSDYGLAGYG